MIQNQITNWVNSIKKDLPWLSKNAGIGLSHLENCLKTGIWYLPFLKRIEELGCDLK
jgi:hypothetical protein